MQFGSALWLIFQFVFAVVSSASPSVNHGLCSKKYPDLYEASIQELQSGLERGDYTSVDLVTAYLLRIDEVNYKGPSLRAVLEINPHALEQAAALDLERRRKGKRSPLHGIPILVKDNIAIRASDGNTTAGSYALLGSTVPGDATVVAKLREAGAILLGKTNLSEWSYLRDFSLDNGWSGRGGQTTNPYYPGADPSGSSSGSGVATAIGLAAASLGTETDGSIVSPSSYNNLVGIKPTVGLTSGRGVLIPASSHQDSVGPMARSVADAAVILSVIAGRDSKDNYTHVAPAEIPDYTCSLNIDAIKGKRFGVPRQIFTDDSMTGNHPSINIEFDRALATIKSLGGIVVDPADIPSAPRFSREDEMMIIKIDFKVDLNRYLQNLRYESTNGTTLAGILAYNNLHEDSEKPEGYMGQALVETESTTGYNSTYYTTLHSNYKIGRDQGIDAVLQAHALDALVLPTNGLTSSIAAIAGYPIVTVPLGFHPEDTALGTAGSHTIFPAPGIPFGLAFMGTAYSEPSLIDFAYAYEQRTRTRLKRRAYSLAIPEIQLEHVIDACSVRNIFIRKD
ncbi:amidase signature enzyme [Rhizoctonia solani]|nr:amidase signature enzyme [Rhizoctonia solani]